MTRRLPAANQAAGGLGALGVLGLLAYPSPLAWAGLTTLLVLAAVRWRRLGRPVAPSPFSLPLGLYLVGAAVGLFITVRPAMAEIRFFGLLAAIGAYYLILDCARTPAAARRVLLSALILTLLAAPLVLIAIAPSLRLDRLPGPAAPLGSFVTLLDAPFEPMRALLLGSDDFGQRYRLSSAGLGILAAYGLGLTLGPVVAGPTLRLRLFGCLAALAFGLFLFLPFNRTAMLICALVPAALVALRYRWAFWALLALVAVGAGAVVMLASQSRAGQVAALRFLPDAAADFGPLYERLEYWQNYWALVMDFKLTGVGLGLRSAADLYQRRYLPIDPGFNHAHNMFLQSYLEQGLLGLVGLLVLAGLALKVGSQALRQGDDAATRMVAISGSAAALVLLLEGLTEIVPLTTVGMVLLFGAFALMLAARRLATAAVDEQAERRVLIPSGRRALPVAASAVALMLVAGVAIVGRAQAAQSSGQANVAGGPFQAVLAQATLNLGSIELLQGTFDENRRRGSRSEHQRNAERLLRWTLELEPGNLSAYRSLADLAVARNEAGEARRWLAEARRRASENDSRFLFQVGRLYKETGSVDLAIASWTRVDRDLGAWSCSSPDLQLVRWGRQLAAQERYESAAKAYRAAIQIRPTDPLPYKLLAEAMVAEAEDSGEGRIAARLTARERMQALTHEVPDVPWGYLEVAQLYRRSRWQSHDELALDWTRRAAQVEDSVPWRALEQHFQPFRTCTDLLRLERPFQR